MNSKPTRKQLKELGYRVFRKNGWIAIQYQDYGIEYGSHSIADAWKHCAEHYARKEQRKVED